MWYLIEGEVEFFCKFGQVVIATSKTTYLYEADDEESVTKFATNALTNFWDAKNTEDSKVLYLIKNISKPKCIYIGKELYSGMSWVE
jgi:hypothetical protein